VLCEGPPPLGGFSQTFRREVSVTVSFRGLGDLRGKGLRRSSGWPGKGSSEKPSPLSVEGSLRARRLESRNRIQNLKWVS